MNATGNVNIESVSELRNGLDALLNVDRAQREAGKRALGRLQSFLPPDAIKALAEHQAASLKDVHAQNFRSLSYVLTQLSAHGDAAAVKAICRTFRSPVFEYRAMALFILRSIETDAAASAIRRRTRFLSFAPKKDRNLARALLDRNRPVTDVVLAHCPELVVDMLGALGQ